MSDDTAYSSSEHHAKTPVRGGRPLPPRLLYMGMPSLEALLFSLAYTIYGLYAVNAATLEPLALTLVGTSMELAVFLAEAPTGMVADLYSIDAHGTLVDRYDMFSAPGGMTVRLLSQ